MAFIDDIRQLAHEARAIPGDLGVHPYTVDVVVRAWTGGERGQGTLGTTTTAIVEANGQPPHVRWLNKEEIAVGDFEMGTVEVGNITPEFTTASGSGGTSLSTLQPALADNDVFYYVLTGPRHPTGGHYRLKEITHHVSTGFKVILERAAGA